MVSLAALWLPILLSAIAVFMVSTLVHMVLKYHQRDYDKLPDEEGFMGYLRQHEVPAGNYFFPCALTAEERKRPEVVEAMTNGPAGSMIVRSGLSMGQSLGTWFILCLAIGTFVAYLATLSLGAGAASNAVFRFVATAALLGYSGSTAVESIWMGRRWTTTFRHIFDGILYALATGGVFVWLWP